MKLKSLMAVVALFAASGCAPKLYVNVLQPSPVNLGAAKQLSIMQTEGRRSARERVIQEIASRARSDGYFTVTDRSEEGITVKIAGRTVDVSQGKGGPQRPDEIGLRIDVLDWSANRDSQTTRDTKGREYTRTFYRANVLLGVTAFNQEGKTYLAEKEYRGEMSSDVSEDQAINAAAVVAVKSLLNEITPTYVQKAIRLDNDDDSQKPIIEMAKNGDTNRAMQEERAVVQKNPNSAPAVYNLAVLLDALGAYNEAIGYYDQAIKLVSKDYYVEMKTECAKRLADASALSK